MYDDLDIFIKYCSITGGKAVCPICNKRFFARKIGVHIEACIRKLKKKERLKQKIYRCKYCSSEWRSKTALGGHIIKCYRNSNRHECINNIRLGHLGNSQSDETRAKIKMSLLNYWRLKRENKLNTPLSSISTVQKIDGVIQLVFKSEV